MRFQAVIFDLDGTLLDTLADIADAMNSVLSAGGFPTHPLEAYKTFVGDGVRNLARRTLPPDAHRDDDAIDRFTAAMRGAYAKNWNHKTAPYPGVPAMLDALTAGGVRLAILSNKPDDFTAMCVKELLPRWEFDVVLGHRDGLPLKPDPTGAVETARRLGVDPADILYVGDSGMDMQAAAGAGMFPLGVLWGFRSREELLENGALALAGVPADIVTHAGLS
ncbi:MAG TPA: HAD family hydrolase [Halothiobacillaceae bacterium]|nr:HAD family hydrolase [Halothiobacillaceae bacterium]